MSFKIGDRVKMTGTGWATVGSGSLLPIRHWNYTIAAIHPGRCYSLKEHSGKFFIDYSNPESNWCAELLGSPSPAPVTPRTEALTKAADLIGGDRQDDYGSPAESFARIAKLWSALLGTEINASQVAIMLAAMKLSRLTGKNYDHADSWIDLAGYAGLGYEISKGE